MSTVVVVAGLDVRAGLKKEGKAQWLDDTLLRIELTADEDHQQRMWYQIFREASRLATSADLLALTNNIHVLPLVNGEVQRLLLVRGATIGVIGEQRKTFGDLRSRDKVLQFLYATDAQWTPAVTLIRKGYPYLMFRLSDHGNLDYLHPKPTKIIHNEGFEIS